MLDRGQARHELALFLEHVPHGLSQWLPTHMDRLDDVMAQLRHTLTFLQQHDVIHFDVDFGNILVDEERPYLTDFGLTLDRQFDLSAAEKSLFQHNQYYDYGMLLLSLSWHLVDIFDHLPDVQKQQVRQQFQLDETMLFFERHALLQQHLDALHRAEVLGLSPNFVDWLTRHTEVIEFMRTFFVGLRENPQKDTTYSQAELRRLLAEAGFLPASALLQDD